MLTLKMTLQIVCDRAQQVRNQLLHVVDTAECGRATLTKTRLGELNAPGTTFNQLAGIAPVINTGIRSLT